MSQSADNSLINRRPLRSPDTPVKSLEPASTRKRRQDPTLRSQNDGHKNESGKDLDLIS
jgi:hypothetical protein